MRIDQDTYTNNRLYYGMPNSSQRKQVEEFRVSQFTELFVEEYPEYYLKLQCDSQILIKYMNRMIKDCSFNDMSKLTYSVDGMFLESVTFSEFYILIRKFSNYISKGMDTKKELGLVFQTIPQVPPF